MINTFEEFLQSKFAPEGALDDDLPDLFDSWLANLDGEEYIEYADQYGELKYQEGVTKGIETEEINANE